jgi:hypothetical protein
MGSNRNSFTESLANFFTPKDNYEYRGGDLYEKGSNTPYAGDNIKTSYGTLGQADSSGTGNEEYYQNVTSSGAVRNPSNTTAGEVGVPLAERGTRTSTMQRIIPGLALGAAGFGPLAMGAAMYRGLGSSQYSVPQIDNTQSGDPKLVGGKAGKYSGELKKRVPDSFTTEEIKKQLENDRRGIKTENRIEGSFYKKDKDGKVDDSKLFKLNRFGSSYEVDGYGHPNYGNSKQNRLDMEAGSDGSGGIAMVRRPVGTQATVATNAMPAISAMSEAAASGAFMPIPDPNYDPNDPMSSKYIINPTYDQIAEYQKSILGMARGGEVESALGGNEKDLINDAEKAIRGELDETRAAIILAQYVQQYGEDALRDLVDSVRTGSAQETRDRFARGDNGYVNGNGDGSGTDDKVPAKLKEGDSEQDVLLATKEFVFKESAATALENAGISLDKINDAGTNAPKVLREYFTG